MRGLASTLVVIAALLPLAACGQNVAPQSRQSRSRDVATTSSTPTYDAAMLAAAEPFEKLTETAFSGSPDTLDVTIGEVNDAAGRVRRTMTGNVVLRLDERLADIAAARKSGDRAELAIAAVEGYRVLVSAVSGGGIVPIAVNLLDYAGFRYDADLKAQPTRWADMTQAALVGREQWTLISSRVADPSLRAKMDTILGEMAAAVQGRNASSAAAASQLELALVDDLETYFKSKKAVEPATDE